MWKVDAENADPTLIPHATGLAAPTGAPAFQRREQQAVTLMTETTTRCLFASRVGIRFADPGLMAGLMAVSKAALAEAKVMIEAPQAIWNATSADRQMAFISQDQAPAMFRRLIKSRIAAEQPQS